MWYRVRRGWLWRHINRKQIILVTYLKRIEINSWRNILNYKYYIPHTWVKIYYIVSWLVFKSSVRICPVYLSGIANILLAFDGRLVLSYNWKLYNANCWNFYCKSTLIVNIWFFLSYFNTWVEWGCPCHCTRIRLPLIN